MDFLDPVKNRRNIMFLRIGYSLIGLSIVIMLFILNELANGFNYSNGQIVQQGLVYLASQPNPANIYINNKLYSSQTNSRIFLNSGNYNFKISLSGYRSWQHAINVPGGQVVSYLYPFLFPKTIKSVVKANFSAVDVATESPNQQYILVNNPTNFDSFLLYNINNSPLTPSVISLPSNLVSPATQSQSWKFIMWANDNSHVLLEHFYDGSSEFILLDTTNPANSINLNQQFSISPTAVSLNNLAYNSYYFYNSSNQTLSSASLANPNIVSIAGNILAYKSYLTNIILYATPDPSSSSLVDVYLEDGGSKYLINTLPVASHYLLNMANYNGNDYVVVGDNNSQYLYLYENPQLQAQANLKIKPFRLFDFSGASYESFAPTAQFIVAENGQNIMVYDIEFDQVYDYSLGSSMSANETNIHWMDGDRLYYISKRLIHVFDYDHTNRQILTPAYASFKVFFNAPYTNYYTIAPAKNSASPFDLDFQSLVAS